MSSTAIVVQCFVKTDTLEALCSSILRCEGRQEHHLIFWRDVPALGAKYLEHSAKSAAVATMVERFCRDHGREFASVTVRTNERPMGTCATCRASIDYALERHDLAIFTEDDTVFSRDALGWFSQMANHERFHAPDVLAIAGESVFFDAQARPVPDGYPRLAREAAERRGLWSRFTTHAFVPSTCFAVNRDKWAIFGETRGRQIGANEVNDLCKAQDYKAVFPIVARVKDTGMLHPDGYSVRIHGADKVREIKNTYLMSDELTPLDEPFMQMEGNPGTLYAAGAKLAGFAQEATPA